MCSNLRGMFTVQQLTRYVYVSTDLHILVKSELGHPNQLFESRFALTNVNFKGNFPALFNKLEVPRHYSCLDEM